VLLSLKYNDAGSFGSTCRSQESAFLLFSSFSTLHTLRGCTAWEGLIFWGTLSSSCLWFRYSLACLWVAYNTVSLEFLARCSATCSGDSRVGFLSRSPDSMQGTEHATKVVPTSDLSGGLCNNIFWCSYHPGPFLLFYRCISRRFLELHR
jgi:hypothetical protein